MPIAFYFDKCPIQSGKLIQDKTTRLYKQTKIEKHQSIIPPSEAYSTQTCNCTAGIKIKNVKDADGEDFPAFLYFESLKGLEGLERRCVCVGKSFENLTQEQISELKDYLSAVSTEEVDV